MKKLGDLKKRIFESFFIILIVFLLIFFSNVYFVKPIIGLAVAFLAYLGANEFINFLTIKKVLVNKNLIIGGIIFEILSFFLSSMFPSLNILPVIVFFIFIIALIFSSFRKIEGSLNVMSLSIFNFLYIAVPFGMLLTILFINNLEMQDGRIWIFYLLLVTKSVDIAGYFFGKLFGEKKIAKKISPNKTVFGSISGIIFAIIISLAFSFFSKENVFELSIFEALILGLVLGVFSLIGDLLESLIKRDIKVKDSSNLKGLGGILDMVDSLILNIPIMYFFLIG